MSIFLFQIEFEKKEIFEYPDMVLCPKNWMDFERISRLNLSKEALKFGLSHIFSFDTKQYLIPKYDDLNERTMNEFYEFVLSTSIEDYREFFSLFAKSPEQIGQRNMANIDRKPLNATKLLLQSQICYMFRMEIINCAIETVRYRPKFKIFFPKEKEQFADLSNDGEYHTFLINPTQHLAAGVSRFILDMNKIYVMEIFPRRFRVVNTNQKPCLEKNKENSNYSRRLCEYDCMERQFNLNYKNCMNIGFFIVTKSDQNIPMCNSNTVYPHIEEEDEKLEEIAMKCSLKCPDNCESNMPGFSISSADTRADVRNDTLPYSTIEIVYDVCNQGEMIISEYQKITSVDLVASIGGILGLWIGASSVTFIQIIMCLLEMMVIKIYKRTDRKLEIIK